MTFADLTTTVLEFVRQHPNWSAFVVFALSFGESLPFISLVFPFWAMLVGIGTVIAVADPLIFWNGNLSAGALPDNPQDKDIPAKL